MKCSIKLYRKQSVVNDDKDEDDCRGYVNADENFRPIVAVMS